MTNLRVATVGAGYFSQFHHDAWTRIAGVSLVAVCDTDRTKAEGFAKRFGIPRIYTDAAAMLDAERPDLVDIISPPPSHLALIRLAAERRINAICQKPFCQNLGEAQTAVQEAERAGIRLVVHDNFRFQPWYGEIKQRLDARALGDVYQATFRLRPGDGQGARAYLDRQPYFQTMERFLVHETAIHFIDTFRFLFGKVRSIFADLRRLNPVIAGEDAGLVLFEHAGGVRSLFDGNRLVDHAAENRRLTMGEMLVEGSASVIRLDGDGRLFERAHGSNEEREIRYEWSRAGFGGDSVLRLQEHVVDALRVGRAPANTGRDYLANLAIEEAIYASAQERAIKVV
jgi:predicted dehydrogenase